MSTLSTFISLSSPTKQVPLILEQRMWRARDKRGMFSFNLGYSVMPRDRQRRSQQGKLLPTVKEIDTALARACG